MLRKFSKHFPELHDSSSSGGGSSRSARVHRFLSFVNEKEKVSNSRSKRKRTEMLSGTSNGAILESMNGSK